MTTRRVGVVALGLGLVAAVSAAIELGTREPTGPAASTILRTRNWLLEGLAGEGLAIRWTGADGAVKAEAIVSARDGILFIPAPIAGEPSGLALGPAGLCLAPGGAGRCELPLPGRGQATVQFTLTRRGDAQSPPNDARHEFSIGLKLEARREPDAPPLVVAAELDPAACLAVVTARDATVSIDGDVMLLTTPRGRMRIDVASGRIIDIRLPTGDTVACDLAGDRWRQWRQALLTASGPDRYSATAPVASTAAFLADPATTAAAARILTALGRGGAGEPLPRWLDVCAAGLGRAAAAGGLAPLDAALARQVATADDADDEPRSGEPRPDAAADPRERPAARAARRARDWLGQVCGAEAWPTALAGLVAAVAGQDAAGSLGEAAAYATSERHGPLAHLVAASIVPLPPLAATFAVAGRSRLDGTAFRADCEPVIAIAAELGLDLAAVSVLRRIDDDEVRVLSEAWLGDGAALMPLVRAVRASPTDTAAAADLAGAVDRWWEEALEPVVAAALTRRSEVRVGGTATPTDRSRR